MISLVPRANFSTRPTTDGFAIVCPGRTPFQANDLALDIVPLFHYKGQRFAVALAFEEQFVGYTAHALRSNEFLTALTETIQCSWNTMVRRAPMHSRKAAAPSSGR